MGIKPIHLRKRIRRLGALKQHLFLTVLEAGESKVKAPADLVSGDSQFPRTWARDSALVTVWDPGWVAPKMSLNSILVIFALKLLKKWPRQGGHSDPPLCLPEAGNKSPL